MVSTVYCVVVPGSLTRDSRVRPAGLATSRGSATTAEVFDWPEIARQVASNSNKQFMYDR